MPKCVICGGADFYAEAGFYFCKECQTQNEDVREEVLELRVDLTTRLRRIRIRQDKSGANEQNLGWTTWEQYNFILIGLTNELIELGASMDIKMTILQLWSHYLGKVEVAFTSTKKNNVPKLARKFHKRDAEIIYGKIAQRKKTRRRNTGSNTSASSMVSGVQSEGSSNRDINKQKKRLIAAEYDRFVQSQESSEGDALSVMNQSLFSVQSSGGKSSVPTENKIKFNKAAKIEFEKVKVLSKKLPRPYRMKYREKHTTTQYKIGPQLITPMKLWTLMYLALRIHDDNIHLGDMLRYAREGHLSYYRLDHLLPPEVTLSRKETNMLHQTKELTHRGMRQSIGTMTKFLKVWEMKKPNILLLIERYCIELQLPKGIAIYAERIMAMSPPKMSFDARTACFPNYEGRAMAFIVVVMKILFGLDGITEYEISRVAEKINSAASTRGILESRLFSFREWQRYIECRRSLLTNVHFPTKLKRDPETTGNTHMYLKFLDAMRAKSNDREEPVVTSYKHLIPRELTDAMKKIIGKLDETANSMEKNVEIFLPSLTPQYSYLLQLLNDPEKDLPYDLKTDFYSTKVGHMTKPKTFRALAARCNIDLRITDTGIHFIEKIVPTFEQSRLPSIEEFNKLVLVKKPATSKTPRGTLTRESCDNTEEYLHRKNPGGLFVDSSKRKVYDITHKASRQRRCEAKTDSTDDFGFDEVHPSGKLIVRNEDDSDDESVHSNDNDEQSQRSGNDIDQLSIDFLAKYNVSLSNIEKINLNDNLNNDCTIYRTKKSKRKIIRDHVTGKFLPADTALSLEKTKDVSAKNIKSQKSTLCENEESARIEESSVTNEKRNLDNNDVSTNINVSNSSYDFGLNDDDISILHETSFNSLNDDSERENESSESCDEFETLFRPYTDYWMLRCNFGRVNQKNFRQLETMLPSNFHWLLEECSSVIEMTEEELYEEVCLIETYYADVLKPRNGSLTSKRYDNEEYRAKAHCNAVKKKW